MHVGIISPYSLTLPGGVQGQILGLARALRAQGHSVRVLGPCDGPPPEPGVTPLGNSLPTGANGSIAPIAPDIPAQLRLVHAMRDEAFAVLHLHEPMAPGPTLTAAVTHRYPTVGTFHAAGRSTSYKLIKPWLVSWIKRLDHKVVVSKDALELVQSHLGGEYEVLFNGVEVELIRNAPAMLLEPDAPPAIFFCGRHEERKGLAVLIDAFDRLDVDARLWVASTGPDTDELMARTEGDDRVQWLGRISDEEKYARLRAASVFCAPSLGGESFGVVLIEAMAAGTTVVASSLDGYRNVATHEVDALLSPPRDIDALVAQLRRALTDEQLARRLRTAGNTRAEQFAMRTLADRYIEIYHDLATR